MNRPLAAGRRSDEPQSRPGGGICTALLRRAVAAAVAAAVLATAAVIPARAAVLPLVRDAEAEALVADYARPLLKVAGLGGASISVKIINDTSFNAFVADARHIFINAGVLIDAKTPDEVIGVLAHEIGHLAANHLAQKRQEIARMQILQVLSILGGVAAGAASGNGSAGAAAAMGGMQLGQRSFLAYARGQETAADIAAVRFLDKTGQSAKGMLTTFQRLADSQLFAGAGADPYIQTHPLAQDRVTALRDLAMKSKFFDRPDPPELQARHDLVRAKFAAFVFAPQRTARLYPPTDTGLAAEYARAIVAYRVADPATAVARADELIRRKPDDAYFWELKGQILLETGKPAAAIEPLRKAVALAPGAGPINVLLGQALVGTGEDARIREAIPILTRGVGDDPDMAMGYRQLAIAYARTGNIPMADLSTAQGAFAFGDIRSAKQYAVRAQAGLKTGTPAWLRADDIISYKERP